MPLNFTWIEPQQLAASDLPARLPELEFLHKQGVQAIVTLTERSILERGTVNESEIAHLNLTFFHAPILDMQAPQRPSFTYDVMEFINAMQAQHKPVVVHCLAGQGRTGTMLHAYYLHRGFTLAQAQAKIAAVRPYSGWDNLSDVQRQYLQRLAENLRNGWQV
jgi:atypical dual specificity phosphatase